MSGTFSLRLCSSKLATNNRLAITIDGVDLEHALTQIEADYIARMIRKHAPKPAPTLNSAEAIG